MTIDLSLVQGSPYAWRVQLALEHKQLTYTTRVFSIRAGELKTPEYLALNPRGRVPTLVEDGFVLYESLAILAYLDRRYPTPPIFGDTPEAAGRIWQTISEYTAYVDPAVEAFVLPLYFGTAAERAAEIRAAIATLKAELASLERVLQGSPYLSGKTVSAADFVVFPHVQSILRAASKDAARAFDIPFLPLGERLPAVAAWISRVEAMPNYRRTYPPNWT